jgi:hypothetical protein
MRMIKRALLLLPVPEEEDEEEEDDLLLLLANRFPNSSRITNRGAPYLSFSNPNLLQWHNALV